MNSPDVPIGDALRVLRERKGLNQQQAAKQADNSPDFLTVSHWETARKTPSLRLLITYLRGLGCDLHDFQEILDVVDKPATTAGRFEELERQIDRLARVVADDRRMIDVERRLAQSERSRRSVLTTAEG